MRQTSLRKQGLPFTLGGGESPQFPDGGPLLTLANLDLGPREGRLACVHQPHAQVALQPGERDPRPGGSPDLTFDR